MGNRTVVAKIFWACILRNLSVVSILLSNGKSNRCFNNFLAYHLSVVSMFPCFFQVRNQTVVSIFFLHCKQSICCFNFFFQMKSQTVVSTFFGPWNVANLSVVSIVFSNEKSNRCFNNFLALNCRQSISCFNSFVKWKI